MYELRKDYVRDRYVIISQGDTRARPSARTVSSGATSCVLCPAVLDVSEALHRFPDYGDWHMAVVRTPFGVSHIENARDYGIQELFVEVPEHGLHLEDLPEEHIARLFEAYATRLQDLSHSKKIKHAIIFKNAGGSASGMHAHSQLFATDIIPDDVADYEQRIRNYRKTAGRCLMCDVMKQERKSDRVVYEDARITVFTPYASSQRYEVYIMPRRHLSSLEDLSDDERHSIAGAIRRLFRKIATLRLPSHFSLHQTLKDPNQHIVLTVAPRDYRGLHTQNGIIVNPVSPEVAARFYRE